MQIRRTEAIHDAAEGLDARPAAEIAAILLDGQRDALEAVRGALPALADGAAAMARAVASGGRLHYAAAGSSGLMAAADAMRTGRHLRHRSRARIRIHMAGGLPQDATMPGGTEDDAGAGAAAAARVAPGDAAIVVTASGTTPFACGFAEAARAQGAATIGIANTPGSPLARAGRCRHLPADPARGPCRLDADGGGHRAEDRAQHDLDADGRPARPCPRRDDGQPPRRQRQAARARRRHRRARSRGVQGGAAAARARHRRGRGEARGPDRPGRWSAAAARGLWRRPGKTCARPSPRIETPA